MISITSNSTEYTHSEPRKDRRDKNRRRRWFTSVHNSRVSRGCRAWLMCLAERSSDTAKPVWGNQVKQGDEIGCTSRMIRHYRKEAETAKLIETVRSVPEKDEQGRWSRSRTNIYKFCVPPAIRKQGKSSSHRAEIDFPSNHNSKELYKNLKQKYEEIPKDETKPWSNPPPGGFAAMKRTLRHGLD